MTRPRLTHLACCLAALSIAATASADQAPPANVLTNGDFENAEGYGEGENLWKLHNAAQIITEEDGNRFLRVARDENKLPRAETWIAVDPAKHKKVMISARMRTKGIVPGEQSWQAARVVAYFEFPDNDKKGYIDCPTLWADSDWVEVRTYASVPEGANKLQLHPGIYGPEGSLDLDNIQVVFNPPLEHIVWAKGFAEGKFEAAKPDGSPIGWPNLPPGATREKHEDGGHFIRFDTSKAEHTPILRQNIKVEDDWSAIKFGVRLRVSELELGKNVWETPRLQVMFTDAPGERVGDWPAVPTVDAVTEGWVTKEVELPVPPGTKYVQVSLAMFGCKGAVDFDDVTLDPKLAGELPEGQVLHWGQEPVEALSPARGRMVLNGLWRFAPAVGSNEVEPQPRAWGWARVPGSWDGRYRLPGVISRGIGDAWQDVDFRELAKAWYEREITIPQAWAGRALLLEFARVSTDAKVFVNGQEVGEVHWPAGMLDITHAVAAGEPATVRVLAIAVRDDEMIDRVMGPNQVSQVKAKIMTRGLIDDVMLHSRPAGGAVEHAFVDTSVSKGTFGLDVRLSGVADDAELTFRAEMHDPTGKVEKTFDAKGVVKDCKVALSWPWADARLWDLDQPNLYTMHLHVKGDGIDDVFPQRFGFREFVVDGRRFVLNGQEIRLRPHMIDDSQWSGNQGLRNGMRVSMRAKRALGYNILEMWPWDADDRGRMAYRKHWAEIADEEGMLLMGSSLPSAHPYIGYGSNPKWEQPGVKEGYKKRLELHLRPLQNHPSNVMWSFTANSFGHTEDQNPRMVGMSRDHENWHREIFDRHWHERMARGDEAVAMVKDLDPTRPVLVHQGGPVGDVYALNSYLNFIPLQEREEWLSHWAQHGQMPYLVVEFGTPLDGSYMRGVAGGGWGGQLGGATCSEPLLSEYAAIYFGADAFAWETADYRQAIVDKLRPDQPDDPAYKGQIYTRWQNHDNLQFDRGSQAIQELFIRNTYRSWRAMGITGGMLPWAHAHGWNFANVTQNQMSNTPFKPGMRGVWTPTASTQHLMDPFSEESGTTAYRAAEVIQEVLRDTMAYVGGKPQRFTEKAHHFQAGDTITKQAILLNDARHAKPYDLTVTVTLGNQTLDTQKLTGELSPAQTLKTPIAFDAPQVDAVTHGSITLTGTIGPERHDDAFAFTVFPPLGPVGMPVSVFDPAGKTTAMLEALGVDAIPWDGEASHRPLVIGREALSDLHTPPADIEAYVKRGGRVLVMAQHPEWMQERAGFRVSPAPSRRVYAVRSDHPVMRGLEPDMLRDWAGASTLVEPKPDYLKHDVVRGTVYGKFPIHGWRWGNQGSVASYAIEKSHHAGWRPILECEFDLAYTPLMENTLGHGRIIVTTLALEDQTPHDPAARILMGNLLRYTGRSGVTSDAEDTLYLGGEAGQAMLNRIGLIYKPTDSADAPDGALLIVEHGATVDEAEVASFAERGGRVLVLPTRTGDPFLGATYTLREDSVGSLAPPKARYARGLSASDLRYRVAAPSWLVAGGEGVEVAADGLLAHREAGTGVIVFAQLDPDRFDADTRTYLRYTRWRQTRALTQVLANLGASFATDDTLFDFGKLPRQSAPLPLEGWRGKMTLRLDPLPDNGFLTDPGVTPDALAATKPDFDDSDWEAVEVPGYWELMGGDWEGVDGEAVFRVRFDVHEELRGKQLILSLGSIDDFDDVYINGKLVGRTDKTTPRFWSHHRAYPIPDGVLKDTGNVLAIRVFDHMGNGGLSGKPTDFKLHLPIQPPPALYHADYRTDFSLGDDPYRYCRW